MVQRQFCPFHADEDVLGSLQADGLTSVFVCERTTGHPVAGAWRWMHLPPPPTLAGLSGLAQELGLDTALPAAIAQHGDLWVEYGVVEATYAADNPADFDMLVKRYGHTAVGPTDYSASAFLARTLANLGRHGAVAFDYAPATGRWSYLTNISWWAPRLETSPHSRLSWASFGGSMDYVPGNTE